MFLNAFFAAFHEHFLSLDRGHCSRYNEYSHYAENNVEKNFRQFEHRTNSSRGMRGVDHLQGFPGFLPTHGFLVCSQRTGVNALGDPAPTSLSARTDIQ